jgi:WD40 repeat protein
MQVTVMATPSIRVLHLAAWSIGLGVRLLLTVAFSLGADQQALAQEDKGPVILKVNSLGVQSINFSPNGKTLASGDFSGTIKLWDLSTGKNTLTIPGEKGSISSLTFNPDSKLLGSGGLHRSHPVRIWEVSSGKELRTFMSRTDVHSVTWSPDGKWLCSSDLDGNVRVWDVKTWTDVVTLSFHSGSVTSVAFSPAGKLLASARSDGTTIFYESATWKVLRVLRSHKDTVTSLAFPADGKSLATRSSDGTVKLWEVATGKELAEIPEDGGSKAMAISADGRLLATGNWNGPITLWDVPSRKKVLSLEGHTEFVPDVAFSPNGKLLASASHDGTVRLWDLSKLGKAKDK